MQLVFLALQVAEETPNPGKSLFTLDDQMAMFGLQSGPRDIERNSPRPGKALQFGSQGAVLRLGPRLNRAFAQSLRGVRDDSLEVEVDGVAEALAAGTGAIGVIEGK